MHRIIMYVDATDDGLVKMDKELLSCLGKNPSLNIDWVTWQLDSGFIKPEDSWKIIYFLINKSTICMKGNTK